MFKTISETAKELNVTRQCVYKKLSTLKKELEKHISVENNVKMISNKGIEIIRNDINNQPFTKSKNLTSKEDTENKLNSCNHLQLDFVNSLYESRIKQLEETINYLKLENETKNKQLEQKDKQLDNKDKLLENMQVLLKDQKVLIESKKSIWDKLFKKNI